MLTPARIIWNTERGDVYYIFLYMTVTQHERPEVHYRKQYASISSYKQFCSINTMSATLLFFYYHLTWQFFQWVLIKLAQVVTLLTYTCTLDAGLTGQKPVCVYGCTLSCVSWCSYLRFTVCCGTMGVLLLSYIYLFTKCSLLLVIWIERGAPTSSIRLAVLNSSRGI